MAPDKKLQRSDIKKIKKYWLAGYNHKKTAAKMNVARSTYYAFLRRYGLQKYSQISEEQAISLVNKYQRGHRQTWGYEMIKAALKKHKSMFILYRCVSKS